MAAPIGHYRRCFRALLNYYVGQRISFSKYTTIVKSIDAVLKDGLSSENTAVTVKGWVKSVRDQKKNLFLHVIDGSTSVPLQVVADPAIVGGVNINFNCSVSIEGKLVQSPAKGQSVELVANSIQVIGPCCPDDYPFTQRQRHSLDYVRSFPHLRPKAEIFGSLLRLRNTATMAIHSYFQSNGFCFVHTPIITSNDCEGAGEVFKVEPDEAVPVESGESSEDEELDKKQFFGHPAYLTVSGQLHLEVITGALHKAYTFGPTFRADHSKGRHHLAEFYMVEGEVAFTETLADITQVMEELVKHTSKEIMSKSSDDLAFFFKLNGTNIQEQEKILQNMTEKNFERLTYTEAVKLLESKNKKFEFKVSWGSDFRKEHEKYLVKHCDNAPVFVTDFPVTLKPFYAKVNPDGQTVSAVDLLVPDVGELIGGSLREDRQDVLQHKLKQHDMIQNYQWYLDLRRFGSVPHGGFGLGFERLLQCFLGISNIRDTLPFPRSIYDCKL